MFGLLDMILVVVGFFLWMYYRYLWILSIYKINFFFKYVTPLLPSNFSCLHYNILFSSLCLVKLDHNRRYFCITQATRICIFFLSHVYNNVFKRVGNWINIVLKKVIFILLELFDIFFFVLKPWATWSAKSCDDSFRDETRRSSDCPFFK